MSGLPPRLVQLIALGVATGILAGLILISLTLLLAQLGRELYPSDRHECPSGSQRWARQEGGHFVYACFELHDQRGG